MKDVFPMLLLAFLIVGVAAYVLLQYLRPRNRPRQAPPTSPPPASTAGEYRAVVSEDTTSSEGTSDVRASALPDMARGGAQRGASSGEGHESRAVDVELPIRVHPSVSASEETESLEHSTSAGEEETEFPPTPPEQTEVVRDVSPATEDGESKQEQPILSTGEGRSEANAAGPLSAETASTAVAAEPDRLMEEQGFVEAPSSDEAAGIPASPVLGGSETLLKEEQPPRPEEHDEEDVPKVDLASRRQPPQQEDARSKKARKYKGLARAAPQPRDQESLSASDGRGVVAPRERSLPIEVRLRFLRGGSCSVSLIAKRSDGQPEDLTVVVSGSEFPLRAMQDEWYQDVVPSDFSKVLKDGTLWSQERPKRRCSWSLSGRDLYVLADRSDISGYVSQPCLELGRDHVVLCTEQLRSRVEEAVRETGAQPESVLDESLGVPPGWLVLRRVVPTAPVSPTGHADIFNALRPLPKVSISLERGLRLKYADWIDGHPPSIRVYGSPEHAPEVRIDGQIAERLPDGAYCAPGWDAVGPHSVWCAGTTRSYAIVRFEAAWELWDAYAFPASDRQRERIAICGPLVRAAAVEDWGRESVSVPATNPVLLGAEPGQVVVAARVAPLIGAPVIASPAFRPIWALPRDPLHCDKEAIRIRCFAGSEALQPAEPQRDWRSRGADPDVGRWCNWILDAGRKGMTTEPATDGVRALWLSYKRRARGIWRSRR